MAAAFVVALPSAATARTAAATLNVRISPVTKGAPQVGKLFTVRVKVLNQGPDAWKSGVLRLGLPVFAYRKVTRVRGVESCELPAGGNVTCRVSRLGVLDSAEVLLHVRVPASLGGKLLRIVAVASGKGALTSRAAYERSVAKPEPPPVRPGGPWHGDWKLVAKEDPPPNGNGTTYAPVGVYSITQKGTRLCATWPWSPLPGGRLGSGFAELSDRGNRQADWTNVDGAGTSVWKSRMTADGKKIEGRYVFTPRSGGKQIEGVSVLTKFDGEPIRTPPGC